MKVEVENEIKTRCSQHIDFTHVQQAGKHRVLGPQNDFVFLTVEKRNDDIDV